MPSKKGRGNAMTNMELKDALINQYPVAFVSNRHGRIRYKRVYAIRYIRGQTGEIVVQAELLDYNNGSITIAKAEEIERDGGDDNDEEKTPRC